MQVDEFPPLPNTLDSAPRMQEAINEVQMREVTLDPPTANSDKDLENVREYRMTPLPVIEVMDCLSTIQEESLVNCELKMKKVSLSTGVTQNLVFFQVAETTKNYQSPQ